MADLRIQYENFYFYILNDKECALGDGTTNEANAAVSGASFSGVANIPETVKSGKKEYKVVQINNYSFKSCTEMTAINLPRSIKIIGTDHCFGTKITHYFVPKSVKEIQYSAFSHMSSLISLEFEKGIELEKLGMQCFGSLSAIKEIILPINLGIVSRSIFYQNNNLVYIVYYGTQDLSTLDQPFAEINHTVNVFVASNYPSNYFGGTEVIHLPATPITFHISNNQIVHLLPLFITIIQNKTQ